MEEKGASRFPYFRLVPRFSTLYSSLASNLTLVRVARRVSFLPSARDVEIGGKFCEKWNGGRLKDRDREDGAFFSRVSLSDGR